MVDARPPHSAEEDQAPPVGLGDVRHGGHGEHGPETLEGRGDLLPDQGVLLGPGVGEDHGPDEEAAAQSQVVGGPPHLPETPLQTLGSGAENIQSPGDGRVGRVQALLAQDPDSRLRPPRAVEVPTQPAVIMSPG